MKADRSGAWLEAAREGAFGAFPWLLAKWHVYRSRPARDRLNADLQLARRLRTGVPQYLAPDGLSEKLAAALEKERAIPVPRRPRLSFLAPFALGSLAGAALGIVVALSPRASSPTASLRHELLDSHVRSLLGEHLTDLGTSDQHAVKPWLSSRLGLSPPVQEIEGYTLVGGRLDYVDDHEVAAVVYKRRQHVINLYAWPTREQDAPPRETVDRGFNIITWRRQGLALVAISDLNTRELRQFVQAFVPPG